MFQKKFDEDLKKHFTDISKFCNHDIHKKFEIKNLLVESEGTQKEFGKNLK